MAERWVLNASPLIALAHVGLESLFFDLAEIVLPEEVAEEVAAGPAEDPARQIVAAGRIPIVKAPAAPADIVAWDLGAGETAVLCYALANPGWSVVIDDGAARRCARSFDVPCRSTLSIVLAARQRDLIPSAADALRRLRAGGFRLHDEVIREALRRTVDEDW